MEYHIGFHCQCPKVKRVHQNMGGDCNIKVFNNTIHLPSNKRCGVTAGVHIVLPVSDGQSHTDDLCSALPAFRGGGLAMILLHIAASPALWSLRKSRKSFT